MEGNQQKHGREDARSPLRRNRRPQLFLIQSQDLVPDDDDAVELGEASI